MLTQSEQQHLIERLRRWEELPPELFALLVRVVLGKPLRGEMK